MADKLIALVERKKTMETLQDYVQDGIREVATKQGFTEGQYHIDIQPGSRRGDGFMGKLSRVSITQDGHTELKLIVKDMRESPSCRQYSKVLFQREADMYEKVIPAMKKFQSEKGIKIDEKEDEGFWHVPKCYYTYSNIENEKAVIIMEDLCEKQFIMWERLDLVDFEHASFMLKQLAKLHAVSFAMKDQQPEAFAPFQKYTCPMKIMLEDDEKKFTDRVYSNWYARAVKCLENEDTEEKALMAKLKGVVIDHYLHCVNTDKMEQYAVIGHGDCWIHNAMFTHEGNDPTKKPLDIRIIDWQMSRYASPVLDLSYFLSICTDDKLRAEHYNELLEIYYESLCKYLKQLGGDPERQYPREIYEKQWREYGRFGLLMGFMSVPMVCTPTEELPDMEIVLSQQDSEKDFVFFYAKSGEAKELYRSRMRALIKDVVKYGYLSDEK